MERGRMKRLNKGLFLVLEGIDGAGKTCQIARLKNRLEELGYEVASSREPTESPYGMRIREIARSGRAGIAPEEEVELFVCDREIDVKSNILPVLESGGIVVLDRYYYSNIAYQGALGLEPNWIRSKNYGFPEPDLVLLLDLDPEQGIERIRGGRNEENNQGYEQLDFLKKVRQNYQAMRDPVIRRIDASRSEEFVFQQIWEEVEELLE